MNRRNPRDRRGGAVGIGTVQEAAHESETEGRHSQDQGDSDHDASVARREYDVNTLNKVKISSDSMLFVNDRNHNKNKKKKKKNANSDDNQNEDMKVDLVQFFGSRDQDQLIDEDQLYCLNCEYDYAVTQMLRIFLKSDEVHKQGKYEKKQATDQFFTSCNKIIDTFENLFDSVFRPPLSDSELKL